MREGNEEGTRGDGDGGGGGSCGGGDPTLTVVQTEHLTRAMEKERKGEKKMLVSSFMLNVLSPVSNCTDTTQVATDRRMDGRTDLDL